jgi:hypothetical protein
MFEMQGDRWDLIHGWLPIMGAKLTKHAAET